MPVSFAQNCDVCGEAIQGLEVWTDHLSDADITVIKEKTCFGDEDCNTEFDSIIQQNFVTEEGREKMTNITLELTDEICSELQGCEGEIDFDFYSNSDSWTCEECAYVHQSIYDAYATKN